nr:MAG TPA: hypothetical protein [Caudoviricetes sp.]
MSVQGKRIDFLYFHLDTNADTNSRFIPKNHAFSSIFLKAESINFFNNI